MANFKDLENRVSRLEEGLAHCAKEIFSFSEACTYLNLSRSYLYKLTSGQQIPHFKPLGKMIYFEKEELDKWLRSNPIQTEEQLSAKAQHFTSSNNVFRKGGEI